MTRWTRIQIDSIKMALEVNDGSKINAAKWLGISTNTISNYTKNYPEIDDCFVEIKDRVKMRGTPTPSKDDVDPEKRPIGWVPDWYRKKYPSLFVM